MASNGPVRRISSQFSLSTRWLPDWFRTLFLGRPSARNLTFHKDIEVLEKRSSELVAPAGWLASETTIPRQKHRHFVDVVLPTSLVLLRKLTLPGSTRRSLSKAVILDMMRTTPFKADQVYSLIGRRRSATSVSDIAVDHWIARKDEIDLLRIRLAKIGLYVRQVRVQDGPDLPLADFEVEAYPAGRIWRSLNLIAVIVVLVAGTWTIGRPILHLREARAAQETEFERLAIEAMELRESVQSQSIEATERSAFIARTTFRTPVSETLRAVTVMLPDTVWLTDLGFDRAQVTIRGSTAGSAAQILLSLPRNQTLFDPQLVGSVSQAANGRERFEMVFRTQHGAGP